MPKRKKVYLSHVYHGSVVLFSLRRKFIIAHFLEFVNRKGKKSSFHQKSRDLSISARTLFDKLVFEIYRAISLLSFSVFEWINFLSSSA